MNAVSLFPDALTDRLHGYAEFSPCRKYRWWLSRRWVPFSADMKIVSWVMLNPSIAGADTDDPTIRRCIAFSKAWGYGALRVVNLYSLIATKPADLWKHPDPIGVRGNDELKAARGGDLILCAWGANAPTDRERKAIEILRATEKPLHCLGITKGGNPVHPLYQPADRKPVLFERGNM